MLKGKSKAEGEQALASLVEERYDTGVLRRQPFQRDWDQNIHFYAGNQWLYWDSDSGAFKLRATQAASWTVRTVENRFLRLMQASLSLIIGEKRQYQCVPGGDSPNDRIATQLGDKIADKAWEVMGLEELQREFALWMLLTGICGVDTWWDPEAGPLMPLIETLPVRDDETGETREEPVYGPENEPVVARDGRGNVMFEHMGDVTHTIVDPKHFLPDGYATRPRDLRWYIYHVGRPMEYILARWPETGKEVTPEKLSNDATGSSSPSAYFGEQGATHTDDPTSEEPGAIVKQMVVAPGAGPDFPIGGVLWVAGGKLLEFQEGLDEHAIRRRGRNGGLGLHMARCYPVPGRFWPASAGDLLRPLQKRLNLGRSQVYEAIEQQVGGKWLIPRSANIVPNSFKTRPGARVLYDAPFAPAFLQPTAIPRYVIDVVMSLPQFMQELNSTHQATLGQAPRNLRSGLAIAEVQEQDEVGWSQPAAELDNCMGGVMGRTLWLVQQNYVDKRKLQWWDEDTGEWDIEEYEGADLAGVADVRVVPGTSMRRSKTRMMAFVMEILNGQMGVQLAMQYPEFLSRTMEALEMGALGTVFSTFKADASEARREFWQLKKLGRKEQEQAIAFLQDEGAAEVPMFLPMAQTYQSHPTHMKEHGDWLRDPRSHEFGPVIRGIGIWHFNAHYTMHMGMLMATAEEDAEGATSKAS